MSTVLKKFSATSKLSASQKNYQCMHVIHDEADSTSIPSALTLMLPGLTTFVTPGSKSKGYIIVHSVQGIATWT